MLDCTNEFQVVWQCYIQWILFAIDTKYSTVACSYYLIPTQNAFWFLLSVTGGWMWQTLAWKFPKQTEIENYLISYKKNIQWPVISLFTGSEKLIISIKTYLILTHPYNIIPVQQPLLRLDYKITRTISKVEDPYSMPKSITIYLVSLY